MDLNHETPAAMRYRAQIQDCPLPTSDWGHVPTPFGPREVPGFDQVRPMSDEQLCAYMNTQPHVDPAGLAEASRRLTVTHFYNGKAWVWDTLVNYAAWKRAAPTIFDVLMAAVEKDRGAAPSPAAEESPCSAGPKAD